MRLPGALPPIVLSLERGRHRLSRLAGRLPSLRERVLKCALRMTAFEKFRSVLVMVAPYRV
jgi:hypothetical protein